MFQFMQADGLECLGNVLGIAVVIIFLFGGWILQQISEATRRQAQRRQPPPPPRPDGPRRTPAETTQEMADFLRRAGQQQPSQRSTSARPTSPRPTSPQRGSVEILEPPADEPMAEDVDVVQADIVAPRAPLRRRTPVRSHLPPSHLEEETPELGDSLTAEEPLYERIPTHLDDHRLGTLGDSSDAVHEVPSKEDLPAGAVTAAEIAEALRHPERIREAIIMSEILSLPESRW